MKKHGSVYTYGRTAETAARALFSIGFFLFDAVSFLLLRRLTGAPVGSFGALKNVVSGYMECALCCLLLPASSAALIALLERDRLR